MGTGDQEVEAILSYVVSSSSAWATVVVNVIWGLDPPPPRWPHNGQSNGTKHTCVGGGGLGVFVWLFLCIVLAALELTP